MRMFPLPLLLPYPSRSLLLPRLPRRHLPTERRADRALPVVVAMTTKTTAMNPSTTNTRTATMTKRIHPAQTARTITGAAAGLALVGIVTGFQFAAVAQENQAAAAGNTTTATPAPATDAQAGAPAPAAPAPAADAGSSVAVTQDSAPAAVAPAPAAPAPAAPAPAPVVQPAPAPAPAPSNGTTGGSAAKP